MERSITECLMSQMPIKDTITGQERKQGDFLRDWQEFILDRQDDIVSPETKKVELGLERLLDKVGDKTLINEIDAAVNTVILKKTFLHYNKGFADGLKLALRLSEL